MEMEKVASSNIDSIGWADNILKVKFTNGLVYSASGVPEEAFHDFKAAKSKGSHFAKVLRGVYDFKKEQ